MDNGYIEIVSIEYGKEQFEVREGEGFLRKKGKIVRRGRMRGRIFWWIWVRIKQFLRFLDIFLFFYLSSFREYVFSSCGRVLKYFF